jgi:UDP-GlcNAc:undecaprenyl-phosphate GlcNAc-1-phosphate transferase
MEIKSTSGKEGKKNLAMVLFCFQAITGRLHAVIYFIPGIIFIFLMRHYITTRYEHFISPLTQLLKPALFAFLIMLPVTPLVMKAARRFNILEEPRFPKQSKIPIPFLGGLAVFLAYVIVLYFYRPWTAEVKAILLGGGMLFVLGTLDDIRPCSSVLRIMVQLLASAVVIASGLTITFMPHTWWGHIIGVGLTVVWIVGITNATNFIDGVDGLASGFAAIAAGFFFLITVHLGQYDVALLASVIIGCGLGFLVFNVKPAKILLGDGGSTFLGFNLACIALYGGWSDWGIIIALGIPVLILGVLIFDMIYSTVSRIKNGSVRTFRQWLDYHGRDHFHHRLMNLGFKEEQAVIFIYLTSIILGLSALIIEHARVSFPVVVQLIQAALIFIVIILLMRVGRQEPER